MSVDSTLNRMFNSSRLSKNDLLQCSQRLNVNISRSCPWLTVKFCRSSINFSLTVFASSMLIGKSSTLSNIRSCSSRGRRSSGLAWLGTWDEFTTVFSFESIVASIHQSFLWQGTCAVLITLILGSTRNSASILRCPGLVGSISLNGPTRCRRTLGKVRRRPSQVSTLPTYCRHGPRC